MIQMKARRSGEAAFVGRKRLSSGAGGGGCQRWKLAGEVGAAGRDVSSGQPGGECYVPARRSAEAIRGRSRCANEVSVPRLRGGEYDAPCRGGQVRRFRATAVILG